MDLLDQETAGEVRALCGLDFDSSLVPMWIHDRRTLAFVAVNSAAVAYYGFPREEFLGMTILDIRPAEDIPEIVKEVLFPHFHDPNGDLRRHLDKEGNILTVGIKGYKICFRGRESELVVVDPTARPNKEMVSKTASAIYRDA